MPLINSKPSRSPKMTRRKRSVSPRPPTGTSMMGIKKSMSYSGNAQARQALNMLTGSSSTTSSSKRSSSGKSRDMDDSTSSTRSSIRSSRLPKSDSSSSMKKSVSFDGLVRAKRALHINNYSVKEVNATWYDANELDCIRDEVKTTIRVMKQQGLDCSNHSHKSNSSDGVPEAVIEEDEEDINGICVRGLEKWSGEGISEKKRRQRLAAKSVLEEQARQRELGLQVLDDERLSEAYRQHSLASQVVAVKDGLQDLEDVKISKEALSKMMEKPSVRKQFLQLMKTDMQRR